MQNELGDRLIQSPRGAGTVQKMYAGTPARNRDVFDYRRKSLAGLDQVLPQKLYPAFHIEGHPAKGMNSGGQFSEIVFLDVGGAVDGSLQARVQAGLQINQDR